LSLACAALAAPALRAGGITSEAAEAAAAPARALLSEKKAAAVKAAASQKNFPGGFGGGFSNVSKRCLWVLCFVCQCVVRAVGVPGSPHPRVVGPLLGGPTPKFSVKRP
jgi:hypothetical protein